MSSKFDRTRREAIQLLAAGTSILSVQRLLWAEEKPGAEQVGAALGALAGQWSFALDQKNEGIEGRWFERSLSDHIHLPGSTDQAGKGSPLPDMAERSQHRASRFIDPAIANRPLMGLSRPVVYTGPAWYERTITIPGAWKGKQSTLFLERCLWQTQVWVDGQSYGAQDSLCAPHVYELGALTPGDHRLVIRVDNANQHKFTDNTHAYSEMTQTVWNGIVGEISLRPRPVVSIGSVQVYPEMAEHQLRVRVVLSNKTGQPSTGTLTFHSASSAAEIEGKTIRFSAPDAEAMVQAELGLKDNARLWDEFSPNLHNLTVSLVSGAYHDQASIRFGIREMATKGTHFAVNGRTTFMRGTHDGGRLPAHRLSGDGRSKLAQSV